MTDTNRYPTPTGAGFAGSQNVSREPVPVSRVQSAQGTLDSNMRSLHEAVSVLEERLQPVLSSPPPEPGKPSSQIKPVASTVAERMHETSDSLCYAINRISALTSRLEI